MTVRVLLFADLWVAAARPRLELDLPEDAVRTATGWPSLTAWAAWLPAR